MVVVVDVEGGRRRGVEGGRGRGVEGGRGRGVEGGRGRGKCCAVEGRCWEGGRRGGVVMTGGNAVRFPMLAGVLVSSNGSNGDGDGDCGCGCDTAPSPGSIHVPSDF